MSQPTTPAAPHDSLAQSAAADKLRPPKMICNLCSTALTRVTALDTSQLPGIHAGFGAHCEACDQTTRAVRGDVAAVKAFYAALEKSSGSELLMGTARPAASS